MSNRLLNAIIHCHNVFGNRTRQNLRANIVNFIDLEAENEKNLCVGHGFFTQS